MGASSCVVVAVAVISAGRVAASGCVPGSFGCPGFDPGFDLSQVLFSGSFSNSMVLQGAPEASAIFGTATPGATVHVSLLSSSGVQYTANASVVNSDHRPEHHGTWKIVLAPQQMGTRGYRISASCPGCTNTTTVATLTDVTFGLVYFCSGQSNMEDPMSQTFSRNTSYAAADSGVYSRVRIFQTWWRPRVNATWILPQSRSAAMPRQTSWEVPSSATLSSFSAVCWYFGQSLADDPSTTGIPIGLVASFVGGTFIEQWTPNASIASCQNTLCGTPTLNWELCGSLFNGNIAPFINQTVGGWVWYQGENNVRNIAGDKHSGYACQMQTLISEWRLLWSKTAGTTDPTAPFGVTQLAGYCSEGFPNNSAPFRLAQTGGWGYLPNPDMPNTFLGQAYDLGDPWAKGCLQTGACFGWDTPFSFNRTCWYEVSYIHPRGKLAVGKRLARGLLALRSHRSTFQPILESCSMVSNGGSSELRIKFNASRLGGDQLTVGVYNATQFGASAMEILVDSAWTFVDVESFSPTEVSVKLGNRSRSVMGVRYAWGDNPCCGDLDRTLYPCPPMSCPLRSHMSQEPAVPFNARLVNGHCLCDAPQSC